MSFYSFIFSIAFLSRRTVREYALRLTHFFNFVSFFSQLSLQTCNNFCMVCVFFSKLLLNISKKFFCAGLYGSYNASFFSGFLSSSLFSSFLFCFKLLLLFSLALSFFHSHGSSRLFDSRCYDSVDINVTHSFLLCFDL